MSGKKKKFLNLCVESHANKMVMFMCIKDCGKGKNLRKKVKYVKLFIFKKIFFLRTFFFIPKVLKYISWGIIEFIFGKSFLRQIYVIHYGQKLFHKF